MFIYVKKLNIGHVITTMDFAQLEHFLTNLSTAFFLFLLIIFLEGFFPTPQPNDLMAMIPNAKTIKAALNNQSKGKIILQA